MISLRPATAEDEPFLRQLFNSTRPDLLLLPLEMAGPLIDMQYRAQRMHYEKGFPNAEEMIVVRDEAPVGRMITWDGGDDLHLVDISLLPEFRGRGIGTSLLSSLIAKGRPVTLMVRADNPAHRLYRRLGFVPTRKDELHIWMRHEEGSNQ